MGTRGVFVLPADKLTFTFDESLQKVSGNLTIQNFTEDRICFKIQSNSFRIRIVSRQGSRGFVEPNSEVMTEIYFNPHTLNPNKHLGRLKFDILWAKASTDCQDPKGFWNSNSYYSRKTLKCSFEFPQGTKESEPGHFAKVVEESPPEGSGYISSVPAQALIAAIIGMIIGVILGQIFFV